jgi:hypothetical protein
MAMPPYWRGSRLGADGLQQSAQGLAGHPRQIGVGGDRLRVRFAAQEINGDASLFDDLGGGAATWPLSVEHRTVGGRG